MKKLFVIITVFVVTAGIFSCGNDDGGYVTVDSAKSGKGKSAGNGKDVYAANCTRCHGDDGKAGVMGAKDLSQSQLDEATAIAMVKNGKGVMPAFIGQISDEDINAVVKYILTLRK